MTFPSFQADFNIPTSDPSAKTRVSAIAVGIQQAFALIGSLAIWPVTNRYGRRPAMMLCSAIFCVGVVFETLRSGSVGTFYLGRVICGLGIGGSATIIPIYLGEMSPVDMRARLGSCYQLTFTVGILVSYWVDYAVVRISPSTSESPELQMTKESWRWQVPIALQMVPGALMGIGALTLHESVRWLLFSSTNDTASGPGSGSSEKEQKAWQSLIWIRGSSEINPDPDVRAEFTTIQQSIQTERRLRADFHPVELVTRKTNRRRLGLGFFLFLAQQSTGATAMAYFGPQFFGMLVGDGDSGSGSGDGNTTTLLLTGVFGAVKVVACGVFVVFVAERFGRRFLLVLGALVMAACMSLTGFLVMLFPPPEPIAGPSAEAEAEAEQGGMGISPAGLVTTLLIYLTITAFNLSWGPLPWPCIAEIFPTRIREPGVASGVAAQWLFNFVWSASTPYIMAGLGWATFVLFGVLDLGIAIVVWLVFVETKGLSLEEIEGLFGEEDDDDDAGNEQEYTRLHS